MRIPQSPLFSAHLAVFLFGLSALFGRWFHLPPAAIVLGRAAFAGASLGILAIMMREKLRANSRRDYVLLLGSGAVLAFHWTAFFASVQHGSVAIATLTFATFPVLTALIEPLLFREKFHPHSLLAALSAFLGVALIALPSDYNPVPLAGIGWGLASAASFAALSLMNRGRVRHYSSRVVALYQNAGAVICLTPFVMTESFALQTGDIFWLMFLGVFCTALAHTLYIQSMRRISATTAGLVACMEPVYAIILAVLLLGEPLRWQVLVGAALILGSTALPGQIKKLIKKFRPQRSLQRRN